IKDVAPRAYFMQTQSDPGAPAVAAIATAPDIFFRLLPAIVTTKESLDAMRSTRSGMILAPAMLKLVGWKVGTPVTTRSPTVKSDGTSDWTFTIVATLEPPQPNSPSSFGIINYDYFNEYRVQDRNTAETFYIRIDDGNKAVATSAAIDRIFE